MKQVLALFAFLSFSLNPLQAQQKIESVDILTVYQAQQDQFLMQVNGLPVDFGYVQPQIKSGRVLVPMRKIFEALGVSVNFDTATKTIFATRSGREVVMSIDSDKATVDGQTLTLEVPAQNVSGTTLVPLRFVSESFNVTVDFKNTSTKNTQLTSHFLPLGTRVTGLRFYESVGRPKNRKDIRYQSSFSASTAKYVAWVVDISYPRVKHRFEFPLRAVYLDSNNRVFGASILNAYIESGWDKSYHYSDRGWLEAGHWKVGSYRVDIYAGSEKIASGTFTIY